MAPFVPMNYSEVCVLPPDLGRRGEAGEKEIYCLPRDPRPGLSEGEGHSETCRQLPFPWRGREMPNGLIAQVGSPQRSTGDQMRWAELLYAKIYGEKGNVFLEKKSHLFVCWSMFGEHLCEPFPREPPGRD